MKLLTFSVSISVISWMVGMIGNALIKNRAFYAKLSNFNFVRSKAFNKGLGVGVFKWIVKNTPFKYFNQKLSLNRRVGVAELKELRKEMTTAEVSHLIGFGFVVVFAAAKAVNGEYLFSLSIMVLNTLLNLHPSLLQQENKRRLDRIINRYS